VCAGVKKGGGVGTESIGHKPNPKRPPGVHLRENGKILPNEGDNDFRSGQWNDRKGGGSPGRVVWTPSPENILGGTSGVSKKKKCPSGD